MARSASYPTRGFDGIALCLRLNRRRLNRQNRLGFLVTTARELAERRGGDGISRLLLERVERRLEDARLVKEDTFQSLTNVERDHLQVSRPAAAAHWNVLTNLGVDHLRYAS